MILQVLYGMLCFSQRVKLQLLQNLGGIEDLRRLECSVGVVGMNCCCVGRLEQFFVLLNRGIE